MTHEKLSEVLRAHRAWLEGKPDGVGADLSGADLRGADLSDANLRGADLSDANLRGADLSDANLRVADLRDANLRVADLRDANLSGADLSGADLRGADLSDANLSGADLRGADLRGADLSGADLRGANLSGADLSGAEGLDGLLQSLTIQNIDAKMDAAIDAGGSLDMGHWHTCETTHCRAGWAINLAGPAGKVAEELLGSCAAGALIYAASRPTKRVPDFYASDADALKDIRECAKEAK